MEANSGTSIAMIFTSNNFTEIHQAPMQPHPVLVTSSRLKQQPGDNKEITGSFRFAGREAGVAL